MRRRDFLTASAALGSVLGFGLPLAWPGSAAAAVSYGEPSPFDAGTLRARARELAEAPFSGIDESLPAGLEGLGYDGYRDIRFRPEEALWREDGLPFQAQFFPRGYIFRTPVRINEVAEGAAREIRYSPSLFDFGANHFDPPLPDDVGFSGFRLHAPLNRSDYYDELVVFQGASFLRALGRNQQYGLFARGVAIDTGLPQGEAFPFFREFWIERPAPGASQIVVHALLDSPALAGAYTFTVRSGDTTVIDVATALFPRGRVERLGIAPLTSMYLFGSNDRGGFNDFRPQVHNSDGLSLWTGAGEWLWRPLVNPSRLQVSAFGDENPRGFGLMQRARDFRDYQDLEARYERRPSAWIEPIGGWGRGAVLLVEIPTDSEIHHNISAFWVPAAPVERGSDWQFAYRLHWCLQAPFGADAAIVASTRTGAGSTPGTLKFVVDFTGGTLGDLAADAVIHPEVSVSRGDVPHAVAQRNEATGGWRMFFDLPVQGDAPIELRGFLRSDTATLTETWSYQWTP